MSPEAGHEPSSFTLEPVSRRAIYYLAGLYVLAMVYVGWEAYTPTRGGPALDQWVHILFWVLALILAAAVVYLGDDYAATVRIDANAIERTGLFNQKMRIPWNEIQELRLFPKYESVDQQPAYPTVLVVGTPSLLRSNRLTLCSRHTVCVKRRDFFKAADCIVAHARHQGVEVKGRLS